MRAAVEWDDASRLRHIVVTMVPAWLPGRADILREATQQALALVRETREP